MPNSRLKLPFNKKKREIKLSVFPKDSNLLIIRHYPNYSLYPIATMTILLSIFSSLLFLGGVPVIIYPVVFFIYIFDYLRTKREINCIIDEQQDKFTYHRSGILGLSFSEQIVTGKASEINRIIIKKVYTRRVGYTLIMFLFLNNGKKLQLSSNNLEINDCKRFIKRLNTFLSREIPITGIKYL